MNKNNKSFIRSLARGLLVLQAFTPDHPRLTLTQLSSKTNITIAALQRYTATLQELGFLKRNRHREYYLGPRVLSLGYSYLNSSQIRRRAEALVDEFSQQVNKTMNIAVLDRGHIFFIYRREAQQFLSLDLKAGSRLPAHCTASGKLLLSCQEDEDLKQAISDMEKPMLTPNTICDEEQLFKNLMQTRKRGYSISDRELYLDLYSVAMPIIDMDKKVVASVNLSVSTQDAKGPKMQTMLDQFTELGRTISAFLGYEGKYPCVYVKKGSGEGF